MTRFLKPAEGRTVDCLDGSAWPAEGMDAENTLYVRRRIADGDLIEVERPQIIQEEDPQKPEETPKARTRK